jgi:RyR domain-containing protein
MYDYKQVAVICHEANRALCIANGDNSQVHWDEAPAWQQNSAVDGVRGIHEGTIKTPQQSHQNWYTGKLAEGWAYGPVKDPEKKLHPCMVPFRELPLNQQAKDVLFFAIVTSLIDVID